MKIIVVEGIDGAGKTSFIENLKKQLIEYKGLNVHVYKPIGDTPSSKAVREYLDNSTEVKFSSNKHLIYSYLTAMMETMDNVMKHQDEDDTVIILDRWILSTIAYGLISFEDTEYILYDMVSSFLFLCPVVDRTILIDVDIDKAIDRLKVREGENKDIYSSKDKLSKISKNFLNIFNNYSTIDINGFNNIMSERLFGNDEPIIFYNNGTIEDMEFELHNMLCNMFN